MSEVWQFPQPEGYVEALMADAMNWLNVVGHYDHNVVKPDTPYNRANGEVLRYLGNRMAHGDLDTAMLLSTFERQARQATPERSGISTAEFQNDVRTNTFYHFASTLNRYAGRPYNN